ncbi:hypothetical protein OPV22_007451 [Ensete ventricosum]|uniref:Protein kinase domain-containing protein n=1 Tax=Ensete ventricosum TaxID=4639 RepID=A0AAV8RUR9_ENSVE|nr:hypothetical protein OPV22_007451 [Ensete ventricosum]
MSPSTSLDSPFCPSPDVCPHLTALRPCHFVTSVAGATYRHTSWQNRLLSELELLFDSCTDAFTASSLSPFPAVACQLDEDIVVAFTTFLHHSFHVEWDSSTDPCFAKCSFCNRTAWGTCDFNDSTSGKPFMCFPSFDHLHRNDLAASCRLLFLTITLFATVCVLHVFLSIWAAVISLRRRCRGSDPSSDTMTDFLLQHHLHPLIYTYKQLCASTDGFDPCHKIGDGKFKSIYLARLNDGRIGAVKHLHRQHPTVMATKSYNEILMIT